MGTEVGSSGDGHAGGWFSACNGVGDPLEPVPT
jgi:hypothetical protein